MSGNLYEQYIGPRRASRHRETDKINAAELQRLMGFLNDAVVKAQDELIALSEREAKLAAAQQPARDAREARYPALRGR